MPTGCYHHGETAVQELTPRSRTQFNIAQVPSKFTPQVCSSWSCSGALIFSEAVFQVCSLWGLPEGEGKVSHPLYPTCSAGPPGITYKVICRWLFSVLCLEVCRKGQAVNQVWLLLVPGLGPLRESNQPTGTRCSLCERF